MTVNTQLTLDQLRFMNLYGMTYACEAAIMLPVHEQPEADTLLGKLVKLIDDDAVAEVFVDACLGILRLQKKYGSNRLEAACGVALQVPGISCRLTLTPRNCGYFELLISMFFFLKLNTRIS